MSTDRLDELGVPRRAFLKRAGAAALAAPLIVSFGIDAIAEGTAVASQSAPNQCLPNQIFANQTFNPRTPVWRILTALSVGLEERVHGGPKPLLSVGEANPLAALAVQASLFEAAGEYMAAYRVWGQFIALAKARSQRLPGELAQYLIREAQRAQGELNCN